MPSTFAIIDRYIIPILIAVMFIEFHVCRVRVINWLERKVERKGKHFVDLIRITDDSLKIRAEGLAETIIKPAILTLMIEIIVVFIVWKMTGIAPFVSKTLIPFLIFSGTFVPIAEEVVFRGYGIGVLSGVLMSNAKRREHKTLIYILMVIAMSLLFAAYHQNITIYHFIARFVSGLWFSYLYLKNNKNLLPPIIAHSVWNVSLVVFI